MNWKEEWTFSSPATWVFPFFPMWVICLVFPCVSVSEVWFWAWLLSAPPGSFGAAVPHHFIKPCCLSTPVLPSLRTRSALQWYIQPLFLVQLSLSMLLCPCSGGGRFAALVAWLPVFIIHCLLLINYLGFCFKCSVCFFGFRTTSCDKDTYKVKQKMMKLFLLKAVLQAAGSWYVTSCWVILKVLPVHWITEQCWIFLSSVEPCIPLTLSSDDFISFFTSKIVSIRKKIEWMSCAAGAGVDDVIPVDECVESPL